MNEHDTEVISGILEGVGYIESEDESGADIIILNTCCVREKAENKVFGKLGKLERLKSKNPGLIICVCGCMAQQPEVAEKVRRKMPFVDLIFGTYNLHRLPELIETVRKADHPAIEVWTQEGEIVEQLPIKRVPGVRAYVTITYGCNNFCAYCIVPYVRGRERSRSLQDILHEVEELSQQGFKEVMLLGQNVNSYGNDLGGQSGFARLLEKVHDVPGIERFRYMTSHPRDYSNEIIDTVANLPKVCEHFHLPVQAGSNAILKKMRRGYTREYYLGLLDRVRNRVPGASITTDIIVGFPGETDGDFEDTLNLVAKARFDSAFTFLYSPRKGTPAAGMEGQVEALEKQSRFQRLLALQNQISLEINHHLVGKTVEVLVEDLSKNDPSKAAARTRTNKLVIFNGDSSLVGRFIPVAIEAAQTWNLTGAPAKTELPR